MPEHDPSSAQAPPPEHGLPPAQAPPPEHGLPPAQAPLPERVRPTHPLDALDALAASGPRQRNAWALWLFLVVLAAVVVPPLYNHRNPALLGVPFFIWYQFAAVIFGAAVTGLIYVLRGAGRGAER